MNSTARNIAFWVVLLLAIVFLVMMLNTGMRGGEQEPSFTEFMNKVDAGQVANTSYSPVVAGVKP